MDIYLIVILVLLGIIGGMLIAMSMLRPSI